MRGRRDNKVMRFDISIDSDSTKTVLEFEKDEFVKGNKPMNETLLMTPSDGTDHLRQPPPQIVFQKTSFVGTGLQYIP